MTTYAALTDGTTTVTFASPGTLGWYRIETGWAPQVAQLRRSQLGGRGPYEDVTEEIPISVGGSNAAHMYANIQALNKLLDRANRWRYGENVPAVTFRYSPESATISSAGSPLIASTWDAGLSLNSSMTNIPQAGGAVWSSGATLRLTRTGVWVHNSASGSATGLNGSVITVAVASAAAFAPTNVTVNNIASGVSRVYGFGISDAASGITIASPDSLTGTYFSTVAKTHGRGGSVLQFAPSATSENYAGLGALTMSASARRVGAMMCLAASPSSITYTIKLLYFGVGGVTYPYGYTNTLYYTPQNFAQAEWVNFGAILLPGYPANYRIYVTPSSSGGSLWMDSLAFFDFTNSGTYQYNGLFDSTLKTTLTVSNNYYSELYPAPYITASSADYMSATALGDLSVSTSGGSVYCVLMANDVNQINNNNNYQQGPASMASGGSTNTWTITRRNSYLSPV